MLGVRHGPSSEYETLTKSILAVRFPGLLRAGRLRHFLLLSWRRLGGQVP